MLTKLDELYLPDHYHLTVADECYYGGEYTARQGFDYSETNSLILNLKKKMDKRGLPQWIYKGRAIRKASEQLLESLTPGFLATATFIPVPPSKAVDHPLYDDRITQVLRLLGEAVDVRELVYQRESMEDAHSAVARPSPRDLYENYSIDQTLVDKEVRRIAIVDDVLTTGAHFKAMERVLGEAFPFTPIVGLFVARRVPDTNPV